MWFFGVWWRLDYSGEVIQLHPHIGATDNLSIFLGGCSQGCMVKPAPTPAPTPTPILHRDGGTEWGRISDFSFFAFDLPPCLFFFKSSSTPQIRMFSITLSGVSGVEVRPAIPITYARMCTLLAHIGEREKRSPLPYPSALADSIAKKMTYSAFRNNAFVVKRVVKLCVGVALHSSRYEGVRVWRGDRGQDLCVIFIK